VIGSAPIFIFISERYFRPRLLFLLQQPTTVRTFIVIIFFVLITQQYCTLQATISNLLFLKKI
tara:strand:+ start:1604 stop:1792 length:189 start_codon:yes stop_codon:yes gene_type:complete